MNKLKWATVGFALGAGLLSFANVGQAADYSWRASIDLAHGTHRNCGDGPYSNYKIEVTGNKLVGFPEQGESQYVRKITVDLDALKPDGSGRITRVNSRGFKVYFDFDAGVGPRNFRWSSDNMECSYLYKPI
jgi:hypothetical protein